MQNQVQTLLRLTEARKGSALPNLDPISGYMLIEPSDLQWRPSNMMRIPNADYLERTESKLLGARLWRFPPKSANTLHKHVRAEEFYFLLEGVGRIRVGDESLTVPRYGGVLVGPGLLRQVFNDTDSECLWLIIGAPDAELEPEERNQLRSLYYPVDPMQLPPELIGADWPPKA
ncbi:MAG: cupin domain-containing protein [Candidatus Cybelea sp.]